MKQAKRQRLTLATVLLVTGCSASPEGIARLNAYQAQCAQELAGPYAQRPHSCAMAEWQDKVNEIEVTKKEVLLTLTLLPVAILLMSAGAHPPAPQFIPLPR